MKPPRFLLCGYVFFAASAIAADSPKYSIQDLGTLGGQTSNVKGVNSLGHVVGSSLNSTGNFHAYLYYDGAMHDLGTPGGAQSSANAVNDADEVVGRGQAVDGSVHGFLYSRSTNTMLDLQSRLSAAGFGGTESSAVGLNNIGEIVGGATTATEDMHAFVWDRRTGIVRDLHAAVSFGGTNSKAVSISDRGRIAGASEDASGNQVGFVYDLSSGALVRLGALGGATSEAVAINASGQVTGAADLNSSDTYHAYLSGGQTALAPSNDAGTLGGSQSTGVALNDAGVVVGSASDASGRTFAMIYDSTKGMRDLETLLTSNPGWILVKAAAINNAGQIAGSGFISNYEHAFLMTVTDSTPPVITHSVNPEPVNGWNHGSVTVSWSASDLESGVAATSGCSDTVLSLETAGTTLTCSATNNAGLSNADPVIVKIDNTPPTITLTTPANGATYVIGSSVIAAYSCSDSLSGVASCSGPVATGSSLATGAVGQNQPFTVASADVAGNSATGTNAYSVVYSFSGFFSPIQNPPSVNTVRAGQSVPIKWQLRDANGNFISDLGTFASLSSSAVPCDISPSNSIGDDALSSGASALRYDTTANQFLYNWQTSSSWTGCRVLQLTLKDGTKKLARFSFR